MFKQVPFIFLLLISVISCRDNQSNYSTKITNSRTALPNQFHNVLHVGRVEDSKSFSCSGTLLTPLKVVTAAHCLGKNSNSELFVHSYTADGTNRLYIKDVRIHPKYNSELAIQKHDIAIITLRDPIAIPPSSLSSDFLELDDWVTIVGLKSSKSSTTSEEEGAHVISRHYGINQIYTLIGDTYVVLVDQGDNNLSTSENGDSGGALLSAKGELVGLVLGGGDLEHPTDGKKRKVSYFLNLSNTDIKEFINENI